MNLPNAITVARIFLVPLLVVVLLTKFEGKQLLGVRHELVGAAIFAERIRKSVDEALVDTHDHKGLHVTISIGVATIPKMATTSLELMEKADVALYASKRAGRNRVTVFEAGMELKPET